MELEGLVHRKLEGVLGKCLRKSKMRDHEIENIKRLKRSYRDFKDEVARDVAELEIEYSKKQ